MEAPQFGRLTRPEDGPMAPGRNREHSRSAEAKNDEERDTMMLTTDTTCGAACWQAKEDACHCQCGGQNHGILRTAEGVQPARTARIDGTMYTLAAVGGYREVAPVAREVNDSAGAKEVITYRNGGSYEYHWRDTDKGAPARVKPASKDQRAKWPELAVYREQAAWVSGPYLAWVRS